MIIDQISLKLLFNKSVVVCNLNTNNSIMIATKFTNDIMPFFLQFHAQFHIGHKITQPPPKLTRLAYLNNIIIGSNILNIVMIWLSSNLHSNALYKAKINCF